MLSISSSCIISFTVNKKGYLNFQSETSILKKPKSPIFCTDQVEYNEKVSLNDSVPVLSGARKTKIALSALGSN